jgi:hypothetical protein
MLESVSNHEAVAIGIGLAHRVSDTLTHTIERSSRRLLHSLNIPAGSDINRILIHIASLERTVREANNNLEDILKREAP